MKFLRDMAQYTIKDQIRRTMIRNQINVFKLNKIVQNNRLNKGPGLLSRHNDGL